MLDDKDEFEKWGHGELMHEVMHAHYCRKTLIKLLVERPFYGFLALQTRPVPHPNSEPPK